MNKLSKGKFAESSKLSALMIVASLLSMGSAISVIAQTSNANDAKIQAEVTKALNKKQFSGVQSTVSNGVVDLTGSVKVFADKEEADKRVRRIKDVAAVRNDIEVGSGETQVSDQELQQTIIKKISYDRVGYGTTAFNAIGVNVQNGVVTLSGTAYGPVDKSSAVADASYTPGVKDVVDEIQVDPVSPMDDRIRLAVFRAVYGFPSLNKYAIDPAKPIRISVQNGNVTLFGVVDSKADKDAAGIRANGVPGVFSVKNELQVAGQPAENK
ncbi:transport-associated protein [Acidisarcina polymorpha]|uniref:Transport-associated protein n=1 Tax=Acidisarcina polymorpha TaxID=2211140 RepID=A0A2Z5G9G0_9BACT|nr:BON domain-containing protein [Acidisarcina polymorpha]AXC15186.1 transport-associated protein [Acidisarcina polymorpha]